MRGHAVARLRCVSSKVHAAQPRNCATAQPTLRPRLTKTAAFLRLREAATRAGLTLPDQLARKHSAGIEQLMLTMSAEYLDRQRLADLIALALESPQ